jgi:hypothetical protein
MKRRTTMQHAITLRQVLLPGLLVLFTSTRAAIVSAQPPTAEPNAWTGKGPEGGNIHALAIDPVTPTALYAGTEGAGVFKTTDGGENWTAINTGLTGTFVHALAIDPKTPTTLYAGTCGGGVFASQ